MKHLEKLVNENGNVAFREAGSAPHVNYLETTFIVFACHEKRKCLVFFCLFGWVFSVILVLIGFISSSLFLIQKSLQNTIATPSSN